MVLSEAALFTEANVVMPSTLLARGTRARRVMRFWALAWFGNFAGAVIVGWMIRSAQYHSPGFEEHLAALITSKMQYQALGGIENWFRVVLSGVLANWLVGMAAFYATMGRTIIGKYIPVFLAVTMFVTAGFQHSPANMGYFAISIAGGGGPGWGDALLWNVIPAGIGNIIGGALFVAAPFWWIFKQRWGRRESATGSRSERPPGDRLELCLGGHERIAEHRARLVGPEIEVQGGPIDPDGDGRSDVATQHGERLTGRHPGSDDRSCIGDGTSDLVVIVLPLRRRQPETQRR